MTEEFKFDVGDDFFIISDGQVKEVTVRKISYFREFNQYQELDTGKYYYYGSDGYNCAEGSMYATKDEAIQSWVDEQKDK